MATKKKSKKKVSKKKSKTLKKTSGRSLTKKSSVDAVLAEYASKESAREKMSGTNKLSIRGGKFSYQGTNLGKSIEVIILAWTFENAYYDVPFDEDNPSTPACFSLDFIESDMAPHSSSPNKQADDCATCQLNEWGSSERGTRGKACGNRRRLILISADEEDYSEADLVQMTFGPTTLKNWKGYIKGLENKLNAPTFGVFTEISFDEDSSNEVLEFAAVDKIREAKTLKVIMSRLEEANGLATLPYDASGYSGGGTTGSKKKSKKKSGKKTNGKQSKFGRGKK